MADGLSPETSATPFGDFPPVSYEDWRRQVEAELGEQDFERALVSRTHEGLAIQPLYVAADAEAEGLSLGRQAPSWQICAEWRGDDDAPQAVTAALRAGAQALWLCPQPGGAFDLGTCLAGVDLGETPVYLEGDGLASVLLAVATKRDVPIEALRGGLGCDPFRSLLGGEGSKDLFDKACSDGADLCRQTAGAADLACFLVSARPYHEAGATAVQELAFALASGVELLRRLEAEGLSVAEVSLRTLFSFSVGGDVFLEIAKLRAARRLWAMAVAACGGETAAQRMRLHGRTSWRTRTALALDLNLLRSTAEGFAAVVGGADVVTVAPHTEAAVTSREEARNAERLALNVQHVLREESFLDRVEDPAGGSWYVEALTADLARRAWELFQQIEGAGGMAEALTEGKVQDLLRQAAESRKKAAAARRDVITGVSEFPHLDDSPAPAPAAPAPSAWAHVLDTFRDAEGFETLRRQARQLPAAPKAFLVNLGAPRDARARAGFAASLLAAGGIEAVEARSFTASQSREVAAAFTASGASVAVFCGLDAAYPAAVPALAPALREAGAMRLLLAGRPGNQESLYLEAGVDTFLFAGCDALALLADLLEGLEGVEDAR